MRKAKEFYVMFYNMDEQAELTNSDIEIIQCMQDFCIEEVKELRAEIEKLNAEIRRLRLKVIANHKL